MNFVKIMFHSNEIIEWHYMQLEMNWNPIQYNSDLIELNSNF
jgi:hypothetical protein